MSGGIGHTTVLNDPQGHLTDDGLAVDGDLYAALAAAVLGWTGARSAREGDRWQAAVVLGEGVRIASRALGDAAARLSEGDAEEESLRQRVRALRAEAARRLSAPITATLQAVQQRARLLQGLHERYAEVDTLLRARAQGAAEPG